MKLYKNIFKATSLLAVISLSLASCNDWLTIYPQDKIVEENFWEDKNDLEGVRYAAYKSLASQVDKMIVWGDLRSDAYRLNTQQHSDQGNRDNYRNIIQANIDTTWNYYDWSGMYSAIGYCTKVLSHGEEVLEKDKQFTSSEWRQMRAEMVTMRAMCYFYLVRAFKNVPYSTKVINSDSDVEYFPQMPAIDVMTNIINEVEGVKEQARNRFVLETDTKGMITNATIYALLSDMYLWRASLYEGRSKGAPAGGDDETAGDGTTDNESGDNTGENAGTTKAGSTDYLQQAKDDYNSCIKYSELAIKKLKDQFDEERKSLGSINLSNYLSWTNAPSFGGNTIDFMYKNDVSSANRGFVSMWAYDYIFGYGNSYESIFELQFNSSDGRKNTVVNSMWGAFNGTHLVANVSEENRKDMRYWFSAWDDLSTNTTKADYYCMKWNNVDVDMESNIGSSDVVIKASPATNEYHNWIMYRLSDVLLQNAEARACLIKLGENTEDNKTECQKILRIINRRWWVDVVNGGEVSTDLSKKEDYDIDATTNTPDSYLKHVMDTRKIEFMGEGKRWFDLVRYAERLSATDESAEGMQDMYNTFMTSITGYETARNRCENLWGLYCPIFYMECKAYRAGGYNITQNPVWNKSKYDRK